MFTRSMAIAGDIPTSDTDLVEIVDSLTRQLPAIVVFGSQIFKNDACRPRRRKTGKPQNASANAQSV